MGRILSNIRLSLPCLLVASLFIVGCFDDGNSPTIVDNEEIGQRPDVEYNDAYVESRLFYPENEYAIRKLAAVLDRVDVQVSIAYFNNLGYYLAPEESFVIDGKRSNQAAKISFIILKHLETEGRAAVVMFMELEDNTCLSSAVFSIVSPGSERGFTRVHDGVWVKVYNPAEIGLKEARISREQLQRYFNCLYSMLPEYAASCAILCTVGTVGWFHCVSVCTGGRLFGRAISCLISAAGNGGGQDPEKK